jgi:uncharacterized protein (TIGR02266 family)
MTEMRKDRRAPASLKVKYKSATVDDFIEQFGADVSRGGIFIKTKRPLDTGALLKFEFQLHDGEPVIHGVGRVAWRRSEEQSRADLPAGMGIKFIKLAEESRAVIERIETRHGVGSRFDQTESADLAPPLSSLPPTAFASPVPAQPQLHRAAGNEASRPTPVVPAPIAPSSEWPTATTSVLGLNNVPKGEPRVPGLGPSPSIAPGTPTVAPSAPVGAAHTYKPPPPPASVRPSSFPPALGDAVASYAPPPASARAAAPRGVLGGANGASRRAAAPSSRSPARDTSEFLATAFSVGGAGQEVRSQARAQVERARSDPHGVDLASELFGDLGEPRAHPPSVDVEVDLDQELRSSSSSEPKAPSDEERRLAEQIPSIDELVDEPGQLAALTGASVAAPRDAASGDPLVASPRSQGPLSLDLEPDRSGQRSVRTRSAAPQVPLEIAEPKRRISPGLLLAVFAVIAVIVFFAIRASQTPAPVATVESAAPSDLPPSAVPSEPAAPTAAPAAAAPPASDGPAVEVAFDVTSTPRGADLLIDSKGAGKTPTTLHLMSGTTVELSLRLRGYTPKTDSVTVVQGMPARDYVLLPIAHELTITTAPPGALVTVADMSARSPKPLTLGSLAGPITATIELQGFKRVERKIKLDEFHEQEGVLRAQLTETLVAEAQAPVVRKKPAGATGAAMRAIRMAEPPVPGEPAPVMEAKPETTAAPKVEPPPPVLEIRPAHEEPAKPALEPAAPKAEEPKKEAAPAAEAKPPSAPAEAPPSAPKPPPTGPAAAPKAPSLPSAPPEPEAPPSP